MNSLKTSLTVATLALFSFSGLAAQSGDSQKLQGIYSKLDALMLKKDAKGITNAMKETTTADCVFVDASKPNSKPLRLTLEQSLRQFESVLPMIDKVNASRTHIDRVVSQHGSLFANVSSDTTLTFKPQPPDGKAHQFEQISKYVDTWVKSSGGWKLKESKMIVNKFLRDGQPITPPG